jgi:hypothetical protein
LAKQQSLRRHRGARHRNRVRLRRGAGHRQLVSRTGACPGRVQASPGRCKV